jgi:hypothetical protein
LGVRYNTVTQQGPAEFVEYFNDYRKINGVQSAFKMTAYANNEKVSDIIVTEVQYNAEVDRSIFSEE